MNKGWLFTSAPDPCAIATQEPTWTDTSCPNCAMSKVTLELTPAHIGEAPQLGRAQALHGFGFRSSFG